jgi:hypothetical protein
MPVTFCGGALRTPGRHQVRTERGTFIMSGSWIDTTSPSDMMDYDFTASISELKEMHEEIRLTNILTSG